MWRVTAMETTWSGRARKRATQLGPGVRLQKNDWEMNENYPNTREEVEGARIIRTKIITSVLLVICMPLLLVAVHYLNIKPPKTLIALGFITIGISWTAWIFSRCPRCKAPFYRGSTAGNILSVKCRNCSFDIRKSNLTSRCSWHVTFADAPLRAMESQ